MGQITLAYGFALLSAAGEPPIVRRMRLRARLPVESTIVGASDSDGAGTVTLISPAGAGCISGPETLSGTTSMSAGFGAAAWRAGADLRGVVKPGTGMD